MNKDSVIDALVRLANGLESRSKVAQLREVYPYIEAAKRAGFKNLKILETLNAQGFDLTLKAFEMLLYRIRAEAKASATNTPSLPSSHFQSEKGARQSQPTTSIPTSNWPTGQGNSTSPPGLSSKPNATVLVGEPNHAAESSGFGSHDPADLDKIIGSKSDLTALAKLGKRTKK